jgi:hypothetical protein
MLVSYADASHRDKVWASLISTTSDRYVCDAARRAHIVLQIVIDRRGETA